MLKDVIAFVADVGSFVIGMTALNNVVDQDKEPVKWTLVLGALFVASTGIGQAIRHLELPVKK